MNKTKMKGFNLGIALLLTFTEIISSCTPSSGKPNNDPVQVPLSKEVFRAGGFIVPVWSKEKNLWGYVDPSKDSLVIQFQFDHAGAIQNGIALAVKSDLSAGARTIYSIESQQHSIIVNPIFKGNLPFEAAIFEIVRIGENMIMVSKNPEKESFYSLEGEFLGELPNGIESLIHILPGGFLLSITDEQYDLRGPFLQEEFKFPKKSFSIDALQLSFSGNADRSPSLVIRKRETMKEAILLFGSNDNLAFEWDLAYPPNKDSLFIGVKGGRSFLAKWPSEILTALPDSCASYIFWSSVSLLNNTVILDDTTWNSRGRHLLFNFKTTKSVEFPPSRVLYRLNSNNLYAEINGKIHLFDEQGRSLAKESANQVENMRAQIASKSNGFPIWSLFPTSSELFGAMDASGKLIIPPTFDKIDIGESPWRSDFPYIVAERDSGSFKEVYLFGIEGDTLAGPMRLKKWSRGSAYGHNSLAEHILNHSDWRGTPKEEMLFYIEWEDADSVLHKGYIDFFGHLYE